MASVASLASCCSWPQSNSLSILLLLGSEHAGEHVLDVGISQRVWEKSLHAFTGLHLGVRSDLEHSDVLLGLTRRVVWVVLDGDEEVANDVDPVRHRVADG